jgi:hypothetical protein
LHWAKSRTKGDVMNENPNVPKKEPTKTNESDSLTEAQRELARVLGMVLARRWLEEQATKPLPNEEARLKTDQTGH